MSNPKPDYYAVLGLPITASQDDIKKRYRELARKYHPDVNPSPDAAQKIKSVNEAHRVLGDSDRRSLYDAERALNPPPPPQPPPSKQPQSAAKPAEARRPASPFTRRPAPEKPAPTPPPRPRPAAAQTNRTPPESSGADRKVEFNGFGRSYVENPQPVQREAQSQAAALKAERVAKLVSDAQIAFLTRNYNDAERLCNEVLGLNRNAAGAHEILGDIYAVRGQSETAIRAYSYAIQFDPRNYGVQGKLDRLIGRGPSGGGPVVNVSRRHGTLRPSGPVSNVSREAAMMVIGLALFAGGCLALAEFGQNPGMPVGGGLPWITSLSTNLMVTLLVEGIVAGVLLAFYGKLRPVSEELAIRNDSSTRPAAPLLAILAMFSFVWFYASLIVYFALAVYKGRFSASAVRVYAVVLALIVLFTVMAAGTDRGGVGWLETAAFSGNILFPGALVGWFLGDCVRLRGR